MNPGLYVNTTLLRSMVTSLLYGVEAVLLDVLHFPT